MPLTEPQTRLAVTIDRHLANVVARGGGDEGVLVSMVDHMGRFQQLLDTCIDFQINRCTDLPLNSLDALPEGIAFLQSNF